MGGILPSDSTPAETGTLSALDAAPRIGQSHGIRTRCPSAGNDDSLPPIRIKQPHINPHRQGMDYWHSQCLASTRFRRVPISATDVGSCLNRHLGRDFNAAPTYTPQPAGRSISSSDTGI